ncbi:MAG: dockerin type I repeat-containing protein, partial [Gemmatimonadetes bacterium]|nr:dockerin type I repeat-containing protein [Gemmatimonadota bacterium]
MSRACWSVAALLALTAGAAAAAAPVPSTLLQCATTARWGDVNADTAVSIIDAQQIARHTVALSVANATALAARGDVTADGTVSILDAQQIARYTVSLSAATRINTALVATLLVAPASQSLVVGNTSTLSTAARNEGGADVTT